MALCGIGGIKRKTLLHSWRGIMAAKISLAARVAWRAKCALVNK